MKPALIIVDMLQGNFSKNITGEKEEEKIIIPLRDFIKKCRNYGIPIIFACDSFLKEDFIFKGRMKPHAIRGTKDTLPLKELEPDEKDTILEKRRFSAFFKTDLDQTLRTWGIDTVLVTGINTHFCVLATAFDALCHDFYTIILKDLSACYKKNIHEGFMDAYRKSAIYPIFRIMSSSEFLKLYEKTKTD